MRYKSYKISDSEKDSDTDEEYNTSASKREASQSKGKRKEKEMTGGPAAGPATEPDEEEEEGPEEVNTETNEEAVERLNKQMIVLWRERLGIIDPERALSLENLIEKTTTERRPYLGKVMGLREKDRKKEWAYMQLTMRNQDIHQLWTKSRENPKTQLQIDNFSSDRKKWLDSVGEEDVPIELDGFIRPEDRPVVKDTPEPRAPPPCALVRPAPVELASDSDSMSDLFGSDDDDPELPSDSDMSIISAGDATAEIAHEDTVSVPQDWQSERADEIQPSVNAQSQNNADDSLNKAVPTEPLQAPSDAAIFAPESIIIDQVQPHNVWPSDLDPVFSGFQYDTFETGEDFDDTLGETTTTQAAGNQQDNGRLAFFESLNTTARERSEQYANATADPADTSAAQVEQLTDIENSVPRLLSDDIQPFVLDDTPNDNTASGGQDWDTDLSGTSYQEYSDETYAFSREFNIPDDAPASTAPAQHMGQTPESQAQSAQQLLLPVPATPARGTISTSNRKRKKSQLQADKTKRMKLAGDKQITPGAAGPAPAPVDFRTFQQNAQQAALQNHQQRASEPALTNKNPHSNGFFDNQWDQLGRESTPAQLSGGQIRVLSLTQQDFRRRVSMEKAAAVQQDQANSQGMPLVQDPSHRQSSQLANSPKVMQDTLSHKGAEAIERVESHDGKLLQPDLEVNDSNWINTTAKSFEKSPETRGHAGRPPWNGIRHERERALRRAYEQSDFVDERGITHKYTARKKKKTNTKSSEPQGTVQYAANPHAALGLNTSAEHYVQQQQARKTTGLKNPTPSSSGVPGSSGTLRPIQGQGIQGGIIPGPERPRALLPKRSHMAPIPHGAQIPANNTVQQPVPLPQMQQFP